MYHTHSWFCARLLISPGQPRGALGPVPAEAIPRCCHTMRLDSDTTPGVPNPCSWPAQRACSVRVASAGRCPLSLAQGSLPLSLVFSLIVPVALGLTAPPGTECSCLASNADNSLLGLFPLPVHHSFLPHPILSYPILSLFRCPCSLTAVLTEPASLSQTMADCAHATRCRLTSLRSCSESAL